MITTDRAGQELLKGLALIQQEQLLSGEIPSYQHLADGNLEYRCSPFVSTFVHTALGYFDPHSLWVHPQALTVVPAPNRRWFVHTVAGIRRRIRSWLLWQGEPTGMWRFFGHRSGIDPDSDTTACAATVLLESYGIKPSEQWRKHVTALTQFRAVDGRYFSYVNQQYAGYSWMNESGYPIIGFDRVVNANILRYLILAGERSDQVVDYLWREIKQADFRQGSPDYPNPLCFFFMLARTWAQTHLSRKEELASLLVPHILHYQQDNGGFDGPLNTAMALSALLDLGYTGGEIEPGIHSLLYMVQPWGGWGYQDFFVRGFGSAAWTTALSIMVLARYLGEQ